MKRLMFAAVSAGVVFASVAAERKLYVEEFRDRMAGAWIGQSVGVAYGCPTEFRKKGELVTDDLVPAWKPERVNNTFQQDDLYVEMSFLETLEKRGVDVGAREAGLDFANSRYRLWCANANARDNLRRGIAAPDSSHPKNHPTTDDIDYQIEADFSGILSPGLPTRVLRFGQTFGRIMNYGDGLYAGDFIGGMYAAAYFEKDRVKTVEAGLACIPAESGYAEMVRDMLAWYKADPKDWKAAWKKAVDKYGVDKGPKMGKVSFFAIDVKINGAMVLLGYLWGEGDVFRTMDISTRGGYDSDCNPSSALGVLGVQLGLKGFGPEYVAKLDKKATWEFTSYTWDKLLASCEKLTREIVVKEGGRIGKDEKGEYFLIPEKPAAPGPALFSAKPGPGGEARLTEAEMKQVRYAPCDGQGTPSCPKFWAPEAQQMRGPFPIMSTPYFEDGAVDYEGLARELDFVVQSGCPGVIWCQSNDAVDLLTTEEKFRGFEVCAKAAEGKDITLTLGVNGTNTAHMLELAAEVERIAARHPTARLAMASRPPDDVRSEADIEAAWNALAGVTRRPVIFQTYGTDKTPTPSVALLVRLAKNHPKVFGFVKEEAAGYSAVGRMAELTAAKPVIHSAMAGWGGWQWLIQLRHCGCDGLVTERVAFAPVLAKIWRIRESGETGLPLTEAYAMFRLLCDQRNFPAGLRGYPLYFLEKEGVFRNRVSRQYVDKKVTEGGSFGAGNKWKLETVELDARQKAELDLLYRDMNDFVNRK